MLRLLKASLFSLLLLLAFNPAFAEDPPHVRVRLVPEVSAIQPGGQVTIAIEQSIDPEWHTYWKNPGDSGTAPRVAWDMPSGFAVDEIEYPVPKKIPYGPLLNYGYSDSVILLQKIRAPETLPDGPVTLKADIDILVCHDICIPESGTYEVTLNGGSDEENHAYFDEARKQLPAGKSSDAVFYEKDGRFIIEKPIDWQQDIAKYDFIPADWGAVENASPPEIKIEDNKLIISQKRGERSLGQLKELPGLLLWSTDGDRFSAYEFVARPSANAAMTAPGAEPARPDTVPDYSLPAILLFAVLGGLILNLMPCVFPVLSIKALSLVKISEKHPALARLHGLAYTAGVLLSFLVVAGVLISLKSGGAKIGWGFQLQNPEIVTVLAWLFFIVGLNLSGIFDIGVHLGNLGNKLTAGDKLVHSFFTGALATIVATPCTAPFMGAALGFALIHPALISLAVFAALGFGLALPYLLLSFVPPLRKMLPRPGHWMETLRQFLAFPMYASAVWLIWVLSLQSGPMGVFIALVGLLLISFGIWLLRHMPASRFWHVTARVLAALSFITALTLIPAITTQEKIIPAEEDFAETWTPARLADALNGDNPVFVEMTAAWCITCKVNHAVAIDVASTRRLFDENNVEYMLGDWTNQDPAITDYLADFGRSGVPIYVYYGPRHANGTRPAPILLPQLLTPGIVAEIISKNP